MIARFFTTFAIWTIVVLSLTFIGPQAGVWLIALLSMLTQRELYLMLEKMGYRVHTLYGILWSPILILGGFYLQYYFHRPSLDAGLDLFVLAVLVTLLSTLRKNRIADQIQVMVPTLFGILYIPFLFYFFVRILFLDSTYDQINIHSGVLLAIWVVATAKFSDVGALLSGMAFGRHKLASNLSPKKTWEGVIGGILLSAVVGYLLPWAFAEHFPTQFVPWLAALLAIPIATAAVASDLIESVIKRVAGVKDSGHVIPGIGGAFDLTDSMLLSAPIGYLLMKYVVFV